MSGPRAEAFKNGPGHKRTLAQSSAGTGRRGLAGSSDSDSEGPILEQPRPLNIPSRQARGEENEEVKEAPIRRVAPKRRVAVESSSDDEEDSSEFTVQEDDENEEDSDY